MTDVSPEGADEWHLHHMLQHDWGEWVTTKEPTATEEGEMKKVLFGSNLRRTAAFLCALLLSAGVLLFCGCGKRDDGDTHTARTEEVPAQPASAGEETQQSEPGPVPDLSAYGGLVISKVYGNGGNSSAACEHSFIELTNTGSSPLDLGDVALYYRTGTKTAYVSFPLPSVTLEGGRSFLIRGASATDRSSGYDRSKEVIRVEAFDAEWDVALNGKDVKLALAPAVYAGRSFGSDVPPEELPGVISYFAASDEYCFDTGYVTDLSKNTVAVRTALKRDSGYYCKDMTKATADRLEQIAPAAMDGTRAAIVGSKLNEVRFSHAAGFYASPIGLTLTAPDGYGEIYFTTDGSDPTASGTRIRYTDTLTLSDTTQTKFGDTYTTGKRYVSKIASSAGRMIGAHVIKACAYDGKNYTGVYTNSYFISAKMEEFGVAVVSVTLETAQMFGDPGFYHNFDPSSNEPNTRGMAFMEVFDEDGVRRGYSNVELAASGHGSSGTGMRSMKVFYKSSENQADGTDPALYYDLFDGYAVNSKGQSITDFSRLVLRNAGNDHAVSYIRDAYMQRVSRDMAVDTMAYAPVLVFINGDFWGVYNARERYSGDYVQSHYGTDKDDVAIIESDYSQVYSNQNAKFIVTSGLEDDADDFNELARFIRKSDMTEEENYAYVQTQLDLDSLIDLFVSRLYFSARDFPGNNIKLWRDRPSSEDPSGTDHRWHFVLLDTDMGMSFYKDSNSTTETSNYFDWLGSDSSIVSNIMHKLLSNETFKNRFLARFYQVLNEVYVPSRLEEALDEIVAERESVEYLQSERWSASLDKYYESVADMRQFIQRRKKYVLRFLCSYFKITEDDFVRIGSGE